MKERPILFSGPMVRAILEGRKTQTRRVLNPQPDLIALDGKPAWHEEKNAKCKHGEVGDRLWVRETCLIYQTINHIRHATGAAFSEVSDGMAAYKADGFNTVADFKRHISAISDGDFEAVEVKNDRWIPSIHMPRWASRITLEITGVRAERLQQITLNDIDSEGVGDMIEDPDSVAGHGFARAEHYAIGGAPLKHAPEIYGFAAFWDSINGEGSWDANPCVWVIEFKRVEE